MILCLECGHENADSAKKCIKCNANLEEWDSETMQFDDSGGLFSPNRATWGSAQFEEGLTLVLHIADQDKPVRLDMNGRMVWGRKSSNPDQDQPTVDFTPYGAAKMGVSRLHAVIDYAGKYLTITDLNSTNGTFLNGEKLVAKRPRVLRDGDEILIGKLRTKIYFA